MPVFELPLEELRTYRGTNRRPRDFEEFWHRAISEMNEIDPDVELRPGGVRSDFAECFDLFFTGVGGARIHAKYIRPTGTREPHPALLRFHGYSGDSGEWSDKLNYVARGFSVAALDCRGQAGMSQDTGGVTGTTLRGHIIRGLEDHPDKLLFRQIFLDTAQLATIVMSFPEVDASRVGATGESQGGGLTLACAALEPRLKLAAPLFPFLSDYQRVWEMDLCKRAYEELRTFFRQHDPTHAHEEEIFARLGYIDVHHLAPRIEARILLGVCLMDTICPPSTQFAAYNCIAAPKDMVVYPDFEHEVPPTWTDRVWDFMSGL